MYLDAKLIDTVF